jgi:hypothetical protein
MHNPLQRRINSGIVLDSTSAFRGVFWQPDYGLMLSRNKAPLFVPSGFIPLSLARELLFAAKFPDPAAGWEAHTKQIREAISQGGYHISINPDLESMELEGDFLIANAIAARTLLPEIYDQFKGITLKLPTDGWLVKKDKHDSLCGFWEGDYVGPGTMVPGPDTRLDGKTPNPVLFGEVPFKSWLGSITSPAIAKATRTIATETEYTKVLLTLMDSKETPSASETKGRLREKAKAEDGIGTKMFNRAWGAAIVQSRNGKNWSASGARKKLTAV